MTDNLRYKTKPRYQAKPRYQGEPEEPDCGEWYVIDTTTSRIMVSEASREDAVLIAAALNAHQDAGHNPTP